MGKGGNLRLGRRPICLRRSKTCTSPSISPPIMKKETWFYVIAFVLGALVWGVVSAVSGRKEAWDSSWYFSVGYPTICLMALAMGLVVPRRSWRWGVMPFAGQFVWLLI